MKSFSSIVFRVFALCLCAMVLTVTGLGCGKKRPPLPPVQEMIAPPINLAMSLDGTTATLSWSYRVKKGAPPVAGFEIDLATQGGGAGDCKGCPLRFTPLDTTGAETFEFSVEIASGTSHYFRVRAYTGSGVFSESSNTVQVELEK
jgi:hypothetical protein